MAQKLLSPLQVGPLELRNRVVSTAHGAFLAFYKPGESPERYVAYQERRARGGAGLIILQPVHVHRSSQPEGHHRYEPTDLREKFALIADRIHRHGAKTVVQLLHFGAELRSDASDDLTPLWSFSGSVSPTGSEPSHEMTAAEIEEVIEGYERTAALATEAGLDGVELHATHGYLLQQSFSPWANRRTDEWGEQLRFANEVLDRVRAAVGPEKVVGLRISVEDWIRPERGGLGAEGLRDVARRLVETGKLDYLNHSSGSRSAHYSRAIGDYHHPHGEFLGHTAKLRAAISAAIPVVGVGRVTTPELAERALADGTCDLVAMTRAQIADPDLVAKLERGERSRIRPCVGANQGCVDRMAGGLPITCFHNPEVGREAELGDEPAPAPDPRSVVVIGAGPAGLAAAATAARRGHRVRLFDGADRAGGRLGLLAGSRSAELLGSIAWLESELERLGVEVELSTRLAAADLEGLGAEALVIATGAEPNPGGLEDGGDGSVTVVSIDEALTGGVAGRRVLVVDNLGIEEASTAAEMLAADAAELTLASPMPTVGAFLGFTRIKEQQQRLYAAGCLLEAGTVFTGTAGGRACLRHVNSGRELALEVDTIVAGVPGRPRLELRDAAERLGLEARVVGDALAPRTALHAFREGDAAGRAV